MYRFGKNLFVSRINDKEYDFSTMEKKYVKFIFFNRHGLCHITWDVDVLKSRTCSFTVVSLIRWAFRICIKTLWNNDSLLIPSVRKCIRHSLIYYVTSIKMMLWKNGNCQHSTGNAAFLIVNLKHKSLLYLLNVIAVIQCWTNKWLKVSGLKSHLHSEHNLSSLHQGNNNPSLYQ